VIDERFAMDYLGRCLTEEEMKVIEESKRCVFCEHLEVVHSFSYDGYGDLCRVEGCTCDEFMAEGDYSSWTPEKSAMRKQWESSRMASMQGDKISLALQAALVKNLTFNYAWLEAREIDARIGKTMRIQRVERM